MRHFRKVCEHGQLISQCKCPGPKVDEVVRPCPFPEHAVDRVGADLYTAAAQRYAMDAEFHARAVRVEQLVVAAEPQLAEGSRFALRWGAALALHLVDVGAESAHPLPSTPYATVYGCPFRDCPWVLEVPGAAGWAAESDVRGLSPRVLTRLHTGAIDARVREHLIDEHRLAIETLAGLL